MSKQVQLHNEVMLFGRIMNRQKNIRCNNKKAIRINLALPNDDSIVLICNEEGKINGMKLNRDIGHDIIAGPFLILGDDYENGDFKSLTDDQILRYKMRFDKNSIIETENKITAIRLGSYRSNNYER